MPDESITIPIDIEASQALKQFSILNQAAETAVGKIEKSMNISGGNFSAVMQTNKEAVENLGKTWSEFIKGKMGPYMKEFGSHGAAIKKIAEEWKEYKRSVESVTGKQVVITSNITDPQAKIGLLKTELNTIAGKSIPISINATDALAKINILEKELAGLQTLSIAPNVSSTQLSVFNANISRVKAEIAGLRSLSGAQIRIDADISGAQTKISVLQNQFDRLQKIASLPNLSTVQQARLNGLLVQTQRELTRVNSAAQVVPPSFSTLSRSGGEATFALTNFGRIAQDLPYGMIGIANNITPLIESMQRLSVQAKQTGVSVGTQLMNSLKGGGGLILGVSVLTSVMQFAVLGLSAFSRGFGSAGRAARDAASDVKSVNEVLAQSTAGTQGRIAEVNALIKAFSDTSGLKEQSRILSDLKNINESYFGTMKAGVTTYTDLTAAANAYAGALVQQAIVNGLSNAISKLSEEYGNLLIKYQDQTKVANDARISLINTRRENATVVQGMAATNREVGNAENKYNKLNGQLGETGKELGGVNLRIKEFTTQLQSAVALQLQFKPLEKLDPNDIKDKTDEIIARAKQFVKEFGDVFVVPDLEESFSKTKAAVLKDAQKLLDDIASGNLKLKLINFTIPINLKAELDPSAAENLKKSTDELFKNAQLQGVPQKKIIKGAVPGVSEDVAKRNKEFFDQFKKNVTATADLISTTLTPAFQGMFDAITRGQDPLKAFFNNLIQSINQLIARLISAAITAAILSAITGGTSSFGSQFGRLMGFGRGGIANFGNRVAFAGGGGGIANVQVQGVLRGSDIYLSGQAGGRQVGRAGG